MLSKIGTAVVVCLLVASPLPVPAVAAQATARKAAQPSGQQTIQQIQQTLDKLADAEVYDRLEQVEKALASLKPLLKAQPQQAPLLLLRGRLHLAMAEINAELGASAVDYWKYYNARVMPWYEKAQQDFDQIIKAKSPLMAEAYFYKSSSYEDDEASQAADLKQACQLGYKPACQK